MKSTPWPICSRATRVTSSSPLASCAPCGTVHSGAIALRAVAAGRHHRRPGHDHARAGHDALVDRPLETDIGIAGAFGAEIAHRRDAGHQRVARVIDRTGDAIRERFARHLIVPRRLVVGMQQQMRVPFDQPRHQRRARQRDRSCTGRRRTRRPGRLDAIAPHDDDPARCASSRRRRRDPAAAQCRGGLLRARRREGNRDQQSTAEGRRTASMLRILTLMNKERRTKDKNRTTKRGTRTGVEFPVVVRSASSLSSLGRSFRVIVPSF